LRFDGIVFDVDGTLVDSNDAHAAAFQTTIGVYDDPADLLDSLDLLVKDRGSARQTPS
jgi:beta-phosphoglucomutase-like phosphatase (HAD superfamily)